MNNHVPIFFQLCPHSILCVSEVSEFSPVTMILICSLYLDLSPVTMETFWHLVASHLAQGLADNWSQVGQHGTTPNVFILVYASFDVYKLVTHVMTSLAQLMVSLSL